jgi:transposase
MLMLRTLAEGQAASVRLLLSLHLRRLAAIDRDLADIEAAISVATRPFAAQRVLLTKILGVDELTAAAIIAEIGIDMAVFGTAQRLAAWTGICPANHESAGQPNPPLMPSSSSASAPVCL